MINLNDGSLTQPFGTVSLARIVVRPLVPAGSRILVNISVRGLLRQSSVPFPQTRGFSGEILVVSPVSSLAASSHAALAAGPGDENRALAFRRPGAPVELLDFVEENGYYGAVSRSVMVVDPSAPSEKPND